MSTTFKTIAVISVGVSSVVGFLNNYKSFLTYKKKDGNFTTCIDLNRGEQFIVAAAAATTAAVFTPVYLPYNIFILLNKIIKNQ